MFDKIENAINNSLKQWINEALWVLKVSIDQKTPEDTKTLLWNNEIEKASQSGNVISGKVSNDTKYWIYVEYGVSKPYNYHKPKWSIFYTWTWARMFTRGFDEKKREIIKIISNSIKYE
jgi:hypothetical protein